jgi:TonB family protein
MLFTPQAETRRSYLAPGISVAAHAAAFVFLLNAPGLRLPRPAPSEYRQKIAGKEDKIVFYKFRTELPKVTPPKAKNSKQPLRAEVKAKQSIVSSPKNAPKSARMIWTPAPEIAPAPMDLPNVLAVKLPDPPPKPFVAPPEIARPEVAKLDIPDAPELKPVAAAAAEVKQAALPPKAFVKPASAPKPVAAAPQLAPDAPALEARAVQATLVPSTKLPPKAYVPPAPVGRPAVTRAVAIAEAPQIGSVVGPAVSGPLPYAPKLPPKPFTAPSGGSRAASAPSGKGHDLEPPPPLDSASNSRDLNIAIVGLNPNDKSSILPTASSPGQFSAGPVVRAKGADSEGGGAGLSVPNLFVRGPADSGEKKPSLIAQAFAAPTSAENLRAAMSKGEPMVPAHVEPAPSAGHSGAMKVSGAPDPRFNGREVFMMAIQMPNITSYSGSWLMWYSDHTAHEAGLAPIAPPVAHRKVDPKYIATAVSDRIEGRVTLACVIDKQGRVRGVELVRGIDDRLNESAEEALAKWEFFPATRKGEPVEVDVLVEIPFRLEPKIERR